MSKSIRSLAVFRTSGQRTPRKSSSVEVRFAESCAGPRNRAAASMTCSRIQKENLPWIDLAIRMGGRARGRYQPSTTGIHLDPVPGGLVLENGGADAVRVAGAVLVLADRQQAFLYQLQKPEHEFSQFLLFQTRLSIGLGVLQSRLVTYNHVGG